MLRNQLTVNDAYWDGILATHALLINTQSTKPSNDHDANKFKSNNTLRKLQKPNIYSNTMYMT